VAEADPVNGKISNESPLGKAFLGKRIGDKIDVTVPKGILTYTILEIK
ncbi:MAG TPA: GreA/GreB family elongation factor, partial [Patescibacteria group bacterium]|nr:GreA/GreB family elongation factor [Patescibacteria group bacterium]